MREYGIPGHFQLYTRHITRHLVIITNIDWMIDFFLCLYYNMYKRIQRIPKRRRYYGKENHYHQP